MRFAASSHGETGRQWGADPGLVRGAFSVNQGIGMAMKGTGLNVNQGTGGKPVALLIGREDVSLRVHPQPAR